MNKLVVFCFILASIVLLFSCQKKFEAEKEKRKIYYEGTKAYNDLQKSFSIDFKTASELYVRSYMQKFNIKDADRVKGRHEIIINDSYFYGYDLQKKRDGILLVGFLINGNNGEATELNLNIRVTRTLLGYKETIDQDKRKFE